MICKSIDECFNEINTFYNLDNIGYAMLVNIDDGFVYKSLLNKVKADSSKTILRLSDFGKDDNMPNMDAAISKASVNGENTFLLGISQFCMLQSEEILSETINQLISKQTKGKLVILLNGCKNILLSAINNDIRLKRRIILFDETELFLPKILLTNAKDKYLQNYNNGIISLLINLENMDYFQDSVCNKIVVCTKYKLNIFARSKYSIGLLGGVFEAIERDFPTAKAALEKKWGTQEQWEELYGKLKKHNSLSNVMENTLSATVNLSSFIPEKFSDTESIEAWYLFIAMKVFSTKENSYLSLAIKNSDSVESLVENIYLELLNHKISEKDFLKLYFERKSIVSKLNNKTNLVNKYCDHIGKFEKEAVWYLTDVSDQEKLKFLVLINQYDFSKEEILKVVENTFPELYLYLREFKFSAYNTDIPSNDTELYYELTTYFDEYKIQKLTNKIHPEFLDKVNEFAVSRPFNKLKPRTSIISDIDRKNTQLHFFDALGVEYLSYILAKCKDYDLQANIHIGCCFLPSITSKNTEFKKYFKTVTNLEGLEVLPGTKELDELKHHSESIDYTKRPEPIHLFMELGIIDKELHSISEMLSRKEFEKILIVSDHGASRLSVIYQNESELYQVNNGQTGHSGRCCKTDTNPDVPEAVYENGFAVLANYDRFKGGRKANVEVHGGATLEETVIPIIEITKKPENEQIYIVNETIEFHKNDVVSIMLFSNVILNAPRIIIHEFDEADCICNKVDDTHYKFEIPQIKRSSNLTVDLYDGTILKKENMKFKAKKVLANTKDFF